MRWLYCTDVYDTCLTVKQMVITDDGWADCDRTKYVKEGIGTDWTLEWQQNGGRKRYRARIAWPGPE